MLHQLAPEEIGAFTKEGYVILEDFLSADETGVLQTAVRSDYYAGRDELLRVVARTRRAVEAMESLVDLQEVYLCEAKLADDVRQEWHQDYAESYDAGCLYPELGRLLIATESCTWTLLQGSQSNQE